MNKFRHFISKSRRTGFSFMAEDINKKQLKMLKETELKQYMIRRKVDITDDYLLKKQEFIDTVKAGGFIDYDGYGELATETEITHITISPSQVKDFTFPAWCTHICWYNR